MLEIVINTFLQRFYNKWTFSKKIFLHWPFKITVWSSDLGDLWWFFVWYSFIDKNFYFRRSTSKRTEKPTNLFSSTLVILPGTGKNTCVLLKSTNLPGFFFTSTEHSIQKQKKLGIATSIWKRMLQVKMKLIDIVLGSCFFEIEPAVLRVFRNKATCLPTLLWFRLKLIIIIFLKVN